MADQDYSAVRDLAGIYLEDSYVLDIVEELPWFKFKIEAVLTPNHPHYRAPGPDEQYCYATGWLVFADISHVEWERKSLRKYIDAEGEEDMGNIDFLRHYSDHWYGGGDWGEVRMFTTASPRFTLADENVSQLG
ncbi:MAG: hypothetical protein LC808_02240 [Actinobacteria bacterium]|nr:hypothetical protein [Actinomycetota bacterium]